MKKALISLALLALMAGGALWARSVADTALAGSGAAPWKAILGGVAVLAFLVVRRFG